MAAARVLILLYDRSKLAENGRHLYLNHHWAYFLGRVNFVQRKAKMNESEFSVSNFGEVKKSFLTSLHQIVIMEEIPPGLVFNWDQTGIMIVPSTSWTMDQRGAKRVEITGLKDMWQIT